MAKVKHGIQLSYLCFMSGIRINKFIRETGLFSRREADQAIENNRVQINKKVAKLGDTVEPNDIVFLDGEVVDPFKKVAPRKKVLPLAENPKSKNKRKSQKLNNKARYERLKGKQK